MKLIPILFSTPMVQAILDGRKTQTRRIMKPQPTEKNGWWNFQKGKESVAGNTLPETWAGLTTLCPYGQPGDVLLVKEKHYRFGHWKKNGKTKSGKQKWAFVPYDDEVLYFETPPAKFLKSRDKNNPEIPSWYQRSSLFMPNMAVRIFLKTTDVRVQRIQDITESDAIAEGVESFRPVPGDGDPVTRYKDYITGNFAWRRPVASFNSLWQSINGPDSWQSNPYVWAITFERCEKPQQLITHNS